MKLYAISDLHIGVPGNREALAALPYYPEDWLIVAGDVGETIEQLYYTLDILTERFAKVIWVPGNHDLWTVPSPKEPQFKGERRYQHLVNICRNYGVVTPEDPYPIWPGEGKRTVLAPLFVLYDYSFRPDNVSAEEAVAWAEETQVVCADEFLLHPTPYASRSAWCEARCDYTEMRLNAVAPTDELILINHFPLRRECVRVNTIPRFSIWCGTTRTEGWLRHYPVSIAIYGHVHVRATDFLDGVRFEEVSLGYQRNWRQEKGIQGYLREILPGPQRPLTPGAVMWYK
ncbi:metallophosphoesterase family protein [Dictyobacter arantiisoli]|uniref:Metallophosphoesterase n=1 Tax=Dictyobacter arantiisoli TaxID=2014874 RepID=A0A5A5TL95_9CHLR|nr:metallophosphoesterase [Dictyobacter arantiisoli]GCF12048.1 metallophosphoesterase [Dictyobacter arantiisoli]